MIRRPFGRYYVLFIHSISIALSIATAVLGLIVITDHHDGLNQRSLIGLIVGELLMVLIIPMLLIEKKNVDYTILALIVSSTGLSLGAGLSLIIKFIFSYHRDANQQLLSALMGLFISSQFFKGITFNSQFLFVFITSYNDGEETIFKAVNNEKLLEPHKTVAFKSSAQTLVDYSSTEKSHNDSNQSSSSNRVPSDQITCFKTGPNTSSFSRSKLSNAPPSSKNYSIKKLSIINQSPMMSNSVSYLKHQLTEPEPPVTPRETKISDVEIEKNLSIERDALKRIPSALLPPHLKPQDRSFSGLPKTIPNSFSANKIPIKHDNILQAYDLEDIPRSMSIDNMWPSLNQSDSENKIRTISPSEFEQNYKQHQLQQLRGPLKPITLLRKNSYEGSHSSDGISIGGSSKTGSTISHNPGADYTEGDNSTEDALRVLENVQQYNTQNQNNDDELLQSGIDQSRTSLQLERVTSSNSSRKPHHSPHRSVFGTHSRRGSTLSSRHSISLPNSPKKKTSPKRLKLKNLSISGIVYRDEDDDYDLSYVHELQSSPTKRSHTPLKSKSMPFENVLKDKSNTTPESIRSQSSHKSDFPAEVIGEYDKEKWKTMVRMNLVPQSTRS